MLLLVFSLIFGIFLLTIIVLIILVTSEYFTKEICISDRKIIDNWDWLIKRWAEDIRQEYQLEDLLIGSNKIFFKKNWSTGTLLKIRKGRDTIDIKPEAYLPPVSAHFIIIVFFLIPIIGGFFAIYVYSKSIKLRKRIANSMLLKIGNQAQLRKIITEDKREGQYKYCPKCLSQVAVTSSVDKCPRCDIDLKYPKS